MSSLFIKETLNTLYMTSVASLVSFILGGGLGLLMVLIKPGGLKENMVIYKVLDVIINILRSIPFIILMLLIMPMTKAIVNTTIGVEGTMVPLAVAAIPFVARLVENTLSEVDHSLIEMAQSLGASSKEIIWEVYIKESIPSLIKQGTLAVVTILSYGAMAGFLGGGGLGVVAINYGYYRNQKDMMIIAVVLLVILVQLIEWIGQQYSIAINRK